MWLKIDFLSEWHIGSGEGQSSGADAFIVRDHNHLPYVPGKSLKGIIREAVQLADDWGWFEEFQLQPISSQTVTEFLFGTEGATGQGVIRLSSAHLPEANVGFFTELATGSNSDSDISAQAKQCLTITRHFTKINSATGSAENGSLRDIEFAIPLTLLASVSWDESLLTDKQNKWLQEHGKKVVEQSLPLVWHIGAKRQKGMGEVTIEAIAEDAI